jgi:hypothetical protein
MADRAPAAPLHAFITAELDRQGRDKAWLERESEVRRTTIDRWKTQPRRPKAATVNKVAEALGMDPAKARRLAGFGGDAVVAEGGAALAEVDTDALLAEIRRRIPE